MKWFTSTRKNEPFSPYAEIDGPFKTYNEAKVFAIRASHRHGKKVWIFLFLLIGWDPKNKGRTLPIHLPRKRS